MNGTKKPEIEKNLFEEKSFVEDMVLNVRFLNTRSLDRFALKITYYIGVKFRVSGLPNEI